MSYPNKYNFSKSLQNSLMKKILHMQDYINPKIKYSHAHLKHIDYNGLIIIKNKLDKDYRILKDKRDIEKERIEKEYRKNKDNKHVIQHNIHK